MLETLIKLVNNTINIFLIFPNIVLYYVSFIKYVWISKISLLSTVLQSTEKPFTLPFSPVFFILLIEIFFEKNLLKLPKDNGYVFFSKYFTLNWYIFVALTNKKTVATAIV